MQKSTCKTRDSYMCLDLYEHSDSQQQNKGELSLLQ